jgi:hypothetical protein
MKIETALLLPVASVVASGLLLVAGKTRVFEAIAMIASVVWLLIQLGLFNWPISGASPSLVLGGALLVTGVIVYLQTDNKREVTASTVLAILGGVQVVAALN